MNDEPEAASEAESDTDDMIAEIMERREIVGDIRNLVTELNSAIQAAGLLDIRVDIDVHDVITAIDGLKSTLIKADYYLRIHV